MRLSVLGMRILPAALCPNSKEAVSSWPQVPVGIRKTKKEHQEQERRKNTIHERMTDKLISPLSPW
jgi:hypothetical protein